jgi:hypothetical protein
MIATSLFLGLAIQQAFPVDALGLKRYDFFQRCAKTYPSSRRELPQGMSAWGGGSIGGSIFFPVGRWDVMFVDGDNNMKPWQLAMYSAKGKAVNQDWIISLVFDARLDTPDGYLPFRKEGTLPAVLAQDCQVLPRHLSVTQMKSLSYAGIYAEYSYHPELMSLCLVGINGAFDGGSITYRKVKNQRCFPTLPGEKEALKTPNRR